MSVRKTTAYQASNPLFRSIFAALVCAWLPFTSASAQETSTESPIGDAPAAESPVVESESPSAKTPAAETLAAGDDETAAESSASAEGAEPADGSATSEGSELPEGAESPGDAADDDDALNLQTADQEYHLKLNQLEGKISDLKDQIFRSKAKLQMLTEEVTGGLGIGSGLVIVHYNDMSAGFFQLVEAHYFLDGKPLWQEVDDSGELLTEKREQIVLEGPMVEGSHTLTVNLVYRGNGNGLFSYLKGYTWRLKDSYTFTVEAGKQVFIQVHGFEQGNFTTELKDRPAIRFDTEIKDMAN
ncbi:MAG: hypothetical protein GY822_23980 [Deltaproteobacteria bacterium]|nr:hypothetical protein [Deltaproteobacteria bacterium]